MDTPRLALRFRDVLQDIETIYEHRALIKSKSAVWWGWWKKYFEPIPRATFNSMAGPNEYTVLLVNRETKRNYRATCLKVETDGRKVERDLVPSYYRYRDDIAAYFLIREIADTDYDDSLGMRLGESTLLLFDGSQPVQVVSTNKPTKLARKFIVHLSDLHFGSDYAFASQGETQRIGASEKTLTQCLVDDLERLGAVKQVGLVIVTGDFTTQGDWSDETRRTILREFEVLRDALQLERHQVIALPGNHDIVRFPEGSDVDVSSLALSNQTTMNHEMPYRTFVQQLTGRPFDDPLNYSSHFEMNDVEVIVAALNSCAITSTKWTEYGYVGIGGLDVIRTTEPKSRSASSTFKILALHHHPLPVSSVEAPNAKGVSLTLDGVAILEAAAKQEFQLVLHGHQHLPCVSQYARLPMWGESKQSSLIVVAGGSTGAVSNRLPGSERNTYSLIEVTETGFFLKVRELRTDAKAGAMLFDGPLPLVTS